MKLIVQTWSTGSDTGCNADYDYALIDLTPELARHLVVMMEWCRILQEERSSLDEIVLDEPGPRWIVDHVELGDLIDAETGEHFEIQIDEGPQLFLYEGEITIPEEYERYPDLERLILRPESIEWKCWPRHTSIHIHTVEIPLEVIQRFILPKELPGDGNS